MSRIREKTWFTNHQVGRYMLNALSGVVWLACPVLAEGGDNGGGGGGGGGDDFSNNLYSDLAPILSLFGEQVTKQFMSQSMGWADNIIFAMGPVGIITAIVGTIRVGGPRWLKAFVGRAQEAPAVAELELLSSTSSNICEVWNGQAVIRIMGSPQILQLIIFPKDLLSGDKTGVCGLYTLEEANKAMEKLEKDQEESGFILHLAHGLSAQSMAQEREKHPPTDVESGTMAAPSRSKAPRPSSAAQKKPSETLSTRISPNIFFNLLPPSRKLELWSAAVFGILLQIGVLAFSACVAYSPNLAWGEKKNGQTVSSYAYPFALAGTLVLVTGMALCSYVVERRTKERIWRSKKPNDMFHILWVQQGGNFVNDQLLESYAVVASGQRTTLMTSRSVFQGPLSSDTQTDSPSLKYKLARQIGRGLSRITSSLVSHPQDGSRSAVPLSNQIPHLARQSNGTKSGWTDELFSSSLAHALEVVALLATMASVSGYVIQFIGLRGMHWSATIAQLVASLMMVGLRAFVRRGLAYYPRNQKLPQKHELDWLAIRLVGDPDYLLNHGNPNQPETMAASGRPDTDSDEESIKVSGLDGIWRIDAFNNTEDKKVYISGAEASLVESSQANKIVRVRQRLGMLARWPSTASPLAVSIANIIETALHQLNIPILRNSSWDSELVPDGNLDRSFMWSMPVSFKGKTEPVFFRANRGRRGSWHCSASEIEAVLSLWLHTFQPIIVGRAEADEGSGEEGADEGDWPRGAGATLRKERVRLFARLTPSAMRDFYWYLGSGADDLQVVEFLDPEARTNTPGWDDNLREVIGYVGGNIPAITTRTSTDELCYSVEDSLYEEGRFVYESLDEAHGGSSQEKYMAVVTDTPLEMLLAQNIFSAFMCAVAPYLELDEQGSQLVEEESQWWLQYHLGHSAFTKIATEFTKTGLGTWKEAMLCLLPWPSQQQKLPAGLAMIEHLRETAERIEPAGHSDWENVRNRRESALIRWQNALYEHAQLLQLGKTYPPSSRTIRYTASQRGRTTAVFIEFVHVLERTARTARRQHHPREWMHELERLAGRALQLLGNESKLVLGVDDVYGVYASGVYGHRHRGSSRPTPEAMDYIGYGYLDVPSDSELRLEYIRGKGDVFGWTALHHSIVRDTLDESRVSEIAHSEATARLEAKTLLGLTPLHVAAAAGHLPAVHWLLAAGSDIEAQARTGERPLHLAVLGQHHRVVDYLLNRGATTAAADNLGQTPLHLAADLGADLLVERLMAAGSEVPARGDLFGRLPLHLAAMADRASVLAQLALPGLVNWYDGDRLTALMLAARTGAVSAVRVLLQLPGVEGVDRALWWAECGGHSSCVAVLLEHGAAFSEEPRW